ncbi:MAG: hypothetical protein JJ848_000190 [Prochlorococcus marinus CUG1439]|uniref:hypothetical protein n=1 Tax=Prochlorococcus sp. MIT 1314 TaxID=3096220 RepID=UPI001B2C8F1F|nr:hypothetical protein [Prochlorococcus sp. MIT 1314]MCR8538761.1 hypothetical protein [Prochlorococcus marinus CUG1439]
MLIAKELVLYIILSLFFFKIFYKYISKYIIDRPVYRSSHVGDIPTSAGIIFLLIYTIYVLLNNKYRLLILLPIGIIGFLDDIFNIKQSYRFCFQSINIFLTFLLFFNFNFFSDLTFFNILISLLVLFIGLTLVNIINFMDGIDGLVAINMFLILLNYSLSNNLDLIAIPIVLFVFLFYNWSPAKIFMGDSGSTFLGLLLFYITFAKNDFNSAVIVLLTTAPLLMDSLICILRRIRNKENIFLPHKKHLYQRLYQKGMKHSKVSTIYAFCTSILLIFSHTNNLIIMTSLALFVFIIGIYLEKYHALPFNF